MKRLEFNSNNLSSTYMTGPDTLEELNRENDYRKLVKRLVLVVLKCCGKIELFFKM